MGISWQKNSSKYLFLALIISLIIIISTSFYLASRTKKIIIPDNLNLSIKNKDYFLEIAHTQKSRELGLSNRNELCSNCGMLFVFEKEDRYPFWMKDTHLPLDIIWLNSKHQVVKIITALKTDSEEYLVSSKPAKYVVELNANESFKLNLKTGDTIEIPQFDD